MRITQVPIISNKKISADIYSLSIASSYLAKQAKPGQFIHVKTGNNTLLRRPFSIHASYANKVELLFRIRGNGTEYLATRTSKDTLDIVGPLGNGFTTKEVNAGVYQRVFLVAGGMGVAPLVFLTQKLREKNNTASLAIEVFLGAKDKKNVLCAKIFRALKCNVFIATEDGSAGHKGTVIQLLQRGLASQQDERASTIYACGPRELLQALAEVLKKYPPITAQVSFEQFMGCGVGICNACVINTVSGYRKVCSDGPVFNLNEIVFE